MVSTKSKSILMGVAALVCLGSNDGVAAFSTSSSSRTTSVGRTRNNRNSSNNNMSAVNASKQEDTEQQPLIANPLLESPKNQSTKTATTLAASLALVASMATANLPTPANAYIPSDYASETVQTAIKDLKSASGNAKQTFDVYEGIAAIITEGKGVGGQINYSKLKANKIQWRSNAEEMPMDLQE